jgi:hypothetical protein
MYVRCIKQWEDEEEDGELVFKENKTYLAHVVGIDHLYIKNETGYSHCIARDADHEWAKDDFFAEYFVIIN